MTAKGPSDETELDLLLTGENLSIEMLSTLQEVNPHDPEQLRDALDLVNNELIEFPLMMASNNLDLSSTGITRISSALLAYLNENHSSLESIDLSNNHLKSLEWMRDFSFPNLKILHIAKNPISENEINTTKNLFPNIDFNSDTKNIVTLPPKRTPKPITTKFGSKQPVDLNAKQPETKDSKNSSRPSLLSRFKKHKK